MALGSRSEAEFQAMNRLFMRAVKAAEDAHGDNWRSLVRFEWDQAPSWILRVKGIDTDDVLVTLTEPTGE